MNSRHWSDMVSLLQLSLRQALTSLWLLLITWATAARSTSMVISRNITGNVWLTDLTESMLDPSESNLLTEVCARIH